MWKTSPVLILASTSATRKALLANAGIAFDAVPAQVNERAVEASEPVQTLPPSELARALAIAKARSVRGGAVIGADQTLELDGAVLHKPPDLGAARVRLGQLRGRTHKLHSAVALALEGRIVWSHIETALMTMRAFSDAERDGVLAAEGEGVLGAAGAYRVEGPSLRLFESIEGDYFAILGLPLLALLGALRDHAPATLEGFT